MFLNCSNHSSSNWCAKQIHAAQQWGEIIDYAFPNVPENADETVIRNMSEKMVTEIIALQPTIVMCQGEFTLSYMVISGLLKNGISVAAACSQRKVTELQKADGTTEKKSFFQFIRLREFHNY